MLEKITRQIREKNLNVFHTVLYYNGVIEDEILTPTAPCQNCYSLSKSMTSLGIGIAQDMGLLNVNEPFIKYFGDELGLDYDRLLERVTIAHFLTMTMGIEKGFLFEGDRYDYEERNWARLVLSRPLDYEPGTKFTYSNSNYYMLSCLIHRASNITLQEFLRRNLFDRLDIFNYAWETCPCGEAMGATGLYMTTQDVARVGIMCLDGGMYNGKRIVSSEYLAEATRRQVNIANSPNYGYGFWLNEYGYNGSGAYEQTLIVMPERRLVFAAHAFTDNIGYIGMINNALNT